MVKWLLLFFGLVVAGYFYFGGSFTPAASVAMTGDTATGSPPQSRTVSGSQTPVWRATTTGAVSSNASTAPLSIQGGFRGSPPAPKTILRAPSIKSQPLFFKV